MFTHEKLIVYQRSVEWLAVCAKILTQLPSGNADLASQLKRASLSVSLNIAEAAGRVSKLDKKRFFTIARGSALECAAIIDACKILLACDLTTATSAKNLLHEIVCMLTALCKK